jgi:hypothetical protein
VIVSGRLDPNLDSPADLVLEYDAEDKGGNANQDHRRSPAGRDRRTGDQLPIQG